MYLDVNVGQRVIVAEVVKTTPTWQLDKLREALSQSTKYPEVTLRADTNRAECY